MVTATDQTGLQAQQQFVLHLAAVKENNIAGPDRDDQLRGTPSNDYLRGLGGNDTLRGYAGNDVLEGGSGNDTLSGDTGNDTYRFGRGFGQDIIWNHDSDTKGHDVVEFTEYAFTDLTLRRQMNDLVLMTADGSDRLQIKGYFFTNIEMIDEIRFADRVSLSWEDVNRFTQQGTPAPDWLFASESNPVIHAGDGDDKVIGHDGDDTLYGEDGNDQMRGREGNDTMYGGAGDDNFGGYIGNDRMFGEAGDDVLNGEEDDDFLSGGEGKDLLNGGEGNDTYHFARGFGQDVISNRDATAGRHDRIKFSDMNRADLDIHRKGNNLLLQGKDGKDKIIVVNHFLQGSHIDIIHFADGSHLDWQAINALVADTSRNTLSTLSYRAETQALNQAQQMAQAMASFATTQPLDALAMPEIRQPLLLVNNG